MAATAKSIVSQKLFVEFPEHSYEHWKEEAEKPLKGASFESRLLTKTYEEIELKPIYRLEDSSKATLQQSFPGS